MPEGCSKLLFYYKDGSQCFSIPGFFRHTNKLSSVSLPASLQARKKKLKFTWVVITVLIGKLNQFASDSVVLQNTFNYVFVDYFMPRHGFPLSLTVIWTPLWLSPTLLCNLCWNTEATMCLHRTYKSHHSDLRKKNKTWQWIGPPFFKYFPPTREFKQKTIPQCTFQPTDIPRIEVFQLFGKVHCQE